SLNQFSVNPALPYPPGSFARGKVRQLAINVQMLRTNVTYAADFDNIRFDGPDVASIPVFTHDVIDSFEDRPNGLDPSDGPSLMAPWNPFFYADFGNAGKGDRGIQNGGTDGGQSAFEVVANPANPGSFSGFGLSYNFSSPWALPAS